MKYVLVLFMVSFSGCATGDFDYGRASHALGGMSNGLQQQDAYNQQQMYQQQQQRNKECVTSPDGFGNYVTRCY